MIYRFDVCELNTENFTLQINNIKQLVEPHVFDLILYLIKHRNRLVSREELFRNLWAGRAVCDATLSNNIKCARAALGDNGERQLIIKTTRGRGYQFISDVTIASSELNKPNNPIPNIDTSSSDIFHKIKIIFLQYSLLITCFILIIVIYTLFWVPENDKNTTTNKAALQSIAVMPFKNRTELNKDLIMSIGIHDELLVHISKIPQITSISQIALLDFISNKKELPVIHEELGVTILLEGTFQKISDQIRINVHLINVITGENIWANSYTRKITIENILVTQEELAKTIASEIEGLFPQKKLNNLKDSMQHLTKPQ